MTDAGHDFRARTWDDAAGAGRARRAWPADLLLLLTAAIWGFAFVAQRLGMAHVGPLTFNAARFTLGALALLPLAVRRASASARPMSEVGTRPWRDDVPRGLALGAVLFGGVTFQQWGLVFTGAGNAGFITGLYVVLVPVLGLTVGQRTHRATRFGAALAVVGLYLLAMTDRLTMAAGDLLVLASSVFWAWHVLLIGRWSPGGEPIRLACLQFAACAGLSWLGAFAFEYVAWAPLRAVAGPILYAGLLSTGVAYTLQVVVQRSTPPAHAAVILSLEAVFALVGGALVLGESLGTRGLLGCALMLAGMVVSQVSRR